MHVICLEDAAFYELIEQVVLRLKDLHTKNDDVWISDEEAMHLLRIKSKTTLQQYRDQGKIRFSQPQKKDHPVRPTVYFGLSRSACQKHVLVMENDEIVHPDYIKGFNEGYLIKMHLPGLADKIIPAINGSQRDSGFRDGYHQYELEKEREHYPDWMNPDRDDNANLEPDDSRQKDRNDLEPDFD